MPSVNDIFNIIIDWNNKVIVNIKQGFFPFFHKLLLYFLEE